MSQRTQQVVDQEEDEFTKYSEVAERIAKKTAPGEKNKDLVRGLSDASGVVDDVMSDLNNWVEFVDVRVFRGKVIGIPCRYRWTIKRWVSNDMDSWLVENGWNRLAHLKADSKDHRDDEMEARYHKDFGDWDVFINVYVLFTEDVFDMLSGTESITGEDDSGDKSHMEAIREMKRSG